MNLKCGILFEHDEQLIAIPVQNFSKENVINAIAEHVNVEAKHIDQLSASMNRGLYCIKNTVDMRALLKCKVKPIEEFGCEVTPLVFEVQYIRIKQ